MLVLNTSRAPSAIALAPARPRSLRSAGFSDSASARDSAEPQLTLRGRVLAAGPAFFLDVFFAVIPFFFPTLAFFFFPGQPASI